MPAALIAALGYSIGALGGWSAIALWGAVMVLATLSNWVYSEMASMFPDKPGGIALYAHEGWKRHLSLVGLVATFGYWFAWTGAIAVFASIIGSLMQAQWFPAQDWALDWVLFELTFAKLVAVVVLVALWAVNIVGLQITLRLAYVTGAMLMIPLFVFIVLPYFTGNWSADALTWRLGSDGQGLRTALVWLYVMAWTAFGVETCAAFAPEYRDGARDTSRALKAAALFSLGVFILLPLGITGVVGEQAILDDPVTFYVIAFEQIVGGASGIMVGLIIASLVLVMNTSLADGSRALYGMAADRMTVRQLHRLNSRGVPARAMTVALVVNLVLILVVTNVLAILATGNLGYLLAHVFALTGFLLLRRDRPSWPRPIRLPDFFVPLAALLSVVLTVILVVGATSFSITGYGGARELAIALGVLAFSLVLFVFRRVVQDKEPLRLREHEPTDGAASGGAHETPDTSRAGAQQ
jgi:amino acid transporter